MIIIQVLVFEMFSGMNACDHRICGAAWAAVGKA